MGKLGLQAGFEGIAMARRPVSKRQERQVARVRYAIIALVVLVAVGVIVYGTLYSAGVTVGGYGRGRTTRSSTMPRAGVRASRWWCASSFLTPVLTAGTSSRS